MRVLVADEIGNRQEFEMEHLPKIGDRIIRSYGDGRHPKTTHYQRVKDVIFDSNHAPTDQVEILLTPEFDDSPEIVLRSNGYPIEWSRLVNSGGACFWRLWSPCPEVANAGTWKTGTLHDRGTTNVGSVMGCEVRSLTMSRHMEEVRLARRARVLHQ